MKVKAYAKMNLSLGVRGVMPNGYHDLFMLNTKIDFADKIYIRKSKRLKFRMTPSLCRLEENLAYKAMVATKEKFDIKDNFNIFINKKIPSGAGLGGGSADAAAIIKAILKIEKIEYEISELIDLAKKLGADVPYCLFDSKCIVEGIGEKISKVEIGKEYLVLLASPPISLSTKDVFGKTEKSDCSEKISEILANINEPTNYLFNDLEIGAKRVRPDYKLEEIKKDMKKNGARASLMTGSGSSIFGLFEISDIKKIKACKKSMKHKYSNVTFRIMKTISY